MGAVRVHIVRAVGALVRRLHALRCLRALHDVRAVCTSTLQAKCARSPRAARRVQRVARDELVRKACSKRVNAASAHLQHAIRRVCLQ